MEISRRKTRWEKRKDGEKLNSLLLPDRKRGRGRQRAAAAHGQAARGAAEQPFSITAKVSWLRDCNRGRLCFFGRDFFTKPEDLSSVISELGKLQLAIVRDI